MSYLEHKSHKYTRKEYRNGYWRYYYGYGPKSNLIEKIGDKIGFDERMNYLAAKRNYEYSSDSVKQATNKLKDPNYQQENVQTFIKSTLDGRIEEHKYNERELNRHLYNYQKTPLYKMENAINKAKSIFKH